MWMADDATKLYAMAPVADQTRLAVGASRASGARCVAWALVTAALCISDPSRGLAQPKPAHAAEKAERSDRAALQSDYDQLIDRAVAAFQAEDYAQAHELFEQAYALQPNARVLRGLGIAALRLGHYTEAKRQLEAALVDKRQALTATHRAEVSKLLDWIRNNLGTLELHWKPREPAEPRVFCDDELVHERVLVLLPGPHRLSVSAAGFKPQIHLQDVRARETQTLQLTLEPEHPESASARPVAAIAPKPARATEVSVAAIAPERAAATVDAPAPVAAIHTRSAPRDEAPGSSVLSRWWFWTGVAVLAVGGGVAAAFVVKGLSNGPTYESGGVAGVHFALERGR